jgi:glycosyltransferase involved in cell wall biosynthesis
MDKGLYKSKADVGKVVDVLFFARPSQPRRCYELGVEALKQVSRANPAIRIGLYGEDQYGDLGFPYHNFGLIKDVQKLAEIYTKAKVGICFSSTNPSLVGYEMIACGLALVDLRVPGYQVNFNGESFVYYSDPTPESIYKAIAEALTNEPERMRRAAAGTAYVSEMPDDSIIGERLMAVVEKIRADG